MGRLLGAWRRAHDRVDAPEVEALRPKVTAAFAEAWKVIESIGPAAMGDVSEPGIPEVIEVPLVSPAWMQAYHVARLVPEVLHDERSGDMFQWRLVSSSEALWAGAVGQELAPPKSRSAAFGKAS